MSTGQCELYSWAPVSGFSSNDGVCTVDCGARGQVSARQVIVCTNAHTPHLFPNSPFSSQYVFSILDVYETDEDSLTPFQGQAALITPPTSFSGSSYLTNTYTLEKGPYLVSTPSSGIVMGLSYRTAFSQKLGGKKDVWGVVDDSYLKKEFADCHSPYFLLLLLIPLPKFIGYHFGLPSYCRKTFSGSSGSGKLMWTGLGSYCRQTFTGWGEESPGEGMTRVWSGILCASRDTLPLVGEIPEQPGVFVAVGYHGMSISSFLLTHTSFFSPHFIISHTCSPEH